MRIQSRLPMGVALRATLVAAVVSACGGDSSPIPTLDGHITLSSSSVWAGGTLTLESDDFDQLGNDDTLYVVIGDSTDVASKLDDTHYAVRVPGTLSGHAGITVRWRGLQQRAPSIVIYGFTGATVTDARTYEDLHVEPGPMPVVIAGDVDGDLAVINLVTGVVTRLADLFGTASGYRGVGPTPEPGVFVFPPPGAPTLERWRLLPRVERLDALPAAASSRQNMLISELVLFRSSAHNFSVVTRPDDASPFPSGVPTEQAEETEAVFLSPRLDRATIQVDRTFDANVPVFDVTGAVAWRAATLNASYGVAFSADGSRLLFSGRDGSDLSNELWRVQLHDATTGAVLATRVLGPDEGEEVVDAPAGVAFDPNADLVYVVVVRRPSGDGQPRPSVLVLNAQTLATVGEMTAPPSAPACDVQCYKSVIAISSDSRAHVLTTSSAGATSFATIWHFDLLPTQ